MGFATRSTQSGGNQWSFALFQTVHVLAALSTAAARALIDCEVQGAIDAASCELFHRQSIGRNFRMLSCEYTTSAQEALSCTNTPRSTESCANATSWGFCGQSWFGSYCQVTWGTCSTATTSPAKTTATGGAQSTGGPSTSAAATSSSDAALTITSSSATAYCAKLSLPNKLPKATSNWQALVDLGGSTITSVTSASASSNTGTVTFGPANSTTINPGSSAAFSWCANGSANARPKLSAWNFALDVYQTCNSNNGTNPTLAALAIAMGKELGRWNPSVDLYLKDNYIITLTSTGLARCSNGCSNTKAILGQQYLSPSYTSGLFGRY